MGSMSKRDLDCLIFYLFKKHDLIPGKMNRDKAYNLKIDEDKFTNFLKRSDSIYGERDMDASVQKVFEKLGNGKSGISSNGNTIEFIEEDPVVRADFAQDMKSAGFYTDTSFNKEIIRVKAVSFLLYAQAKGRLSEKKILEILKKGDTDKEVIKKFSDAQMSAKDIILGGFEILKKEKEFGIGMIAALFGYGADIATAKLDRTKDKQR